MTTAPEEINPDPTAYQALPHIESLKASLIIRQRRHQAIAIACLCVLIGICVGILIIIFGSSSVLIAAKTPGNGGDHMERLLIQLGAQLFSFLVLLWIGQTLFRGIRYHYSIVRFYQSRIDAFTIMPSYEEHSIETAVALMNTAKIRWGKQETPSDDLLEVYRIKEGAEEGCCCCRCCCCQADQYKKNEIGRGATAVAIVAAGLFVASAILLTGNGKSRTYGELPLGRGRDTVVVYLMAREGVNPASNIGKVKQAITKVDSTKESDSAKENSDYQGYGWSLVNDTRARAWYDNLMNYIKANFKEIGAFKGTIRFQLYNDRRFIISVVDAYPPGFKNLLLNHVHNAIPPHFVVQLILNGRVRRKK